MARPHLTNFVYCRGRGLLIGKPESTTYYPNTIRKNEPAEKHYPKTIRIQFRRTPSGDAAKLAAGGASGALGTARLHGRAIQKLSGNYPETIWKLSGNYPGGHGKPRVATSLGPHMGAELLGRILAKGTIRTTIRTNTWNFFLTIQNSKLYAETIFPLTITGSRQ